MAPRIKLLPFGRTHIQPGIGYSHSHHAATVAADTQARQVDGSREGTALGATIVFLYHRNLQSISRQRVSQHWEGFLVSQRLPSKELYWTSTLFQISPQTRCGHHQSVYIIQTRRSPAWWEAEPNRLTFLSNFRTLSPNQLSLFFTYFSFFANCPSSPTLLLS